MRENTEFKLTRDCEAIQIPSGEKITLPAGTQGAITQSLGGSYTVATPTGLARILGTDADALGLEVSTPAAAEHSGELDEKAVWDQLKTCYDPEIPVTIVDLGLVYDCSITRDDGGAKVNVKMTLTAPGCGMGPTICAEARSKILSIPGVTDAEVDLVWDPVWNQGMISETGRMQLGLV
ncbi:MAG TPA: putative Fe-S cluster assembly protein SufT [Chthoniobacteraceae bacterium]|nr:putative Fe-S cluster assembly protein SufT [Chthoniobacteraceae bacterium]